MRIVTTNPGVSTRAGTSLGALQAAALQLLPGLCSLAAFALLALLLSSIWAIPNVLALALTILLVEVPVSWFIMIQRVRRETGGRFRFADAFPWFDPLPWWHYLLFGVPLVLFSTILMTGVGPRIEALILPSLFAWVPDWFVMQADPEIFVSLSREMLLTLWALMLVSMVLLGGVTQELYARGFLLPRTAWMGRLAPAFNALMFAVFHLIAPWSWPVFFVMVLPWAYLVWWCRSARIGIFIHVSMLAIQWLGMTALVFGLVEPRF